jgi:hypothetical protein
LCEKGDSGFWRLFFFFLLSFIAGCCFWPFLGQRL